MMMVVTAIRRNSAGKLGLFSRGHIRAGTVVWVHYSHRDMTFSESVITYLSDEQIAMVERYAYFSDGKIHLDADYATYMSHSSTPNITTGRGVSSMVALRDIEAGEELTCDYSQFDDYAMAKLPPR